MYKFQNEIINLLFSQGIHLRVSILIFPRIVFESVRVWMWVTKAKSESQVHLELNYFITMKILENCLNGTGSLSAVFG